MTVFPAGISEGLPFLHAASGVGFTWRKTVAEFPTCSEIVATTVAMEGLSCVFRAA